MIRCFDAGQVNEIINHPEIRPYVAGEGVLDAGPLVSDLRNVCLVDGACGAIFAWRGPGVFEGHSFFRTRGAFSVGRRMLAEMHGEYGARLIWGLTPVENRRARMFNRLIGMRSQGVMDTPDGACELFVSECG